MKTSIIKTDSKNYGIRFRIYPFIGLVCIINFGRISYKIITKNPILNMVSVEKYRHDILVFEHAKNTHISLGLGQSNYLMDFIALTITLPFRFVNPLKWRLNTIQHFKAFKVWFGDYILRNKIYVSKFERDCDMVESYSVHDFKSRKEFDAWVDGCYEWAEGALSISRVSKAEYHAYILEYKGTSAPLRDRAMEAYENGRGSNVMV
jgi:hypothetical protein